MTSGNLVRDRFFTHGDLDLVGTRTELSVRAVPMAATVAVIERFRDAAMFCREGVIRGSFDATRWWL